VVVEPFAGREHPGAGTGMAGRIGVPVLVYRGSVAPSPPLPSPPPLLFTPLVSWRGKRTTTDYLSISLTVEKGRARMDSIDLARDYAFGCTGTKDRDPRIGNRDEIAGALPDRKEP